MRLLASPLLCFRSKCFNSRTLGRVRHSYFKAIAQHIQFQFTHPGKGATCKSTAPAFQHVVSIHAPWEGCDGGRRQRLHQLQVSIHAPWGGCDANDIRHCLSILGFQFTHPGKGATDNRTRTVRGYRRFNSRTLGRVRHIWLMSLLRLSMFQFTHPGKGATIAVN